MTWDTQPDPINGLLPADPGQYEVIATGTVTERTLANRFAEWVNPYDFGAIGDGISNDTTAVVNAVTYALTNSKPMFWAKGTFLTTTSIANFHDVIHNGPGVIKRGSTLFYPDPSMNEGKTNNLYVSSTGNNTNDGLTAGEPRLTVQSMGNVIYGYHWGDITWVVNLAAGTYSSTQTSFSKEFPTPNRVQFKGPNVGAGVQPTALVIAATPMTDTIGWYFQNNIRVQVSDVNFKNYREAASPSANNLGLALVFDGRCEAYTTNVWTDDCDQGIYCANGTQIRVQAGRHGFNAINGASIQLIRHCEGSIGYGGSVADVNGITGVAFIGGGYGVLLQELSMSHTDFCYYSAQTLSGVLCNTSRLHSVSSTYFNCLVGIDGRMGSNIGNTSNTFTGCTTDVIVRSRTTLAGVTNIDATDFSPPTKQVLTLAQSTQSTSPVNIFTKNFVAKEFQLRGTGWELKLYGEVVGTAGTKTIVVALGATTLLTAVIAAATTDYEIQVKLVTVSQTIEYLFTRILQNGVLGVRVFNIAIAEDIHTALALTVTHQVANAADLNRIGMIELEITH